MPIPTPFYSRMAALCESYDWRDWSGYLAVSVYEPSHEREYYAVRNSAALFDVSPLFKYEVTGPDALRLVNRVMTRDIAKCAVGQVFYSPWCNDDGKLIDDGTITRLGENHFRITAATHNLRWFQDCGHGLEAKVVDISTDLAALALQGPEARHILKQCVSGADLDSLKFFRYTEAKVDNFPIAITRTGYTGDLLNKTTAYRLLTALESEGMVIRNSRTDTYQLGPEAIALGGRAMRANTLLRVSRPDLETLAEQTKEATTLETLSEGQVLTLDEIPGSHVMGVAQNVGSRWPLHATSTGKTLLAYLPEAEREAILPIPLAAHTPKTITQLDALDQELRQIRAQGYALAQEELEVGFVAIGGPVRNHHGEVIAAISVGGPTARLTPDKLPEMAKLVKETADRISRKLGFREKNSA